MSHEEVSAVSTQFYDALNRMANGEKGAMAGVWLKDAGVTAMHPIGGRETGWDAVGLSFDQVAEAASGGSIELLDQRIEVAGDIAYEIGVEKGTFNMAGKKVDIEQRVTNIYRRKDGAWKLVHHHSDISPAMVDIVSNL